MSNDNTQLKIRIRLDQPVNYPAIEQDSSELAEESLLPTTPPVYIYNWSRIIGVSLLLLLVLAAIFWLVSESMSSSDEAVEINPAETSLSTTLPASSDILSAVPAQPAPATEFLPDQPAGSNPESDEFSGAHTKSGYIENIPNATTSDSISSTVPAPPIRPEFKPESPASQLPQNEMQDIKHPAGLVNAQLTSNIRQRAPLDNIGRISLAGKPSRPIFLFLHFNKFKGGKVFVNWYYRDKRVARVMLPIGDSDWRTYSSKVLNQNRLGSWRATATDQSDKLLAEFKFKVTR
ncbi:DUF2914 domain-containing protein [Nitrosomonas sp. HPC101]|uniref:DUF2914 domain-containing protein n=1 Tax=Nitrosomonas sp. HPC101 TaxID=1658667 RepID=UPI001370DF8F|nr:DUF2914 domain-containing protein [Nitrosomonas sp. HPC101]MXS84390.1 DUF2914 domain-containing protein [Nitrosomonas sp. HPC101]